MTLGTIATPSLTVSLSKTSDINLKPLAWEKSRNTFGCPRYDASASGRDYVVFQSEEGPWYMRACDNSSFEPFDSEEAALTAAENDYKAFVLGFLESNVESFIVPDMVAFPSEPDDASMRALFTLNTATARSSDEVRQVYTWLRNLAATSASGDTVQTRFGAASHLYDANAPMSDGDNRMTAAEEVLAWILIEKIGVPDDVGYSPQQAQDIIVSRMEGLEEINEIEAMLSDGQGDDDGARILPDFRPGMSVVGKVEACLHLLERRRDVLDASRAAKTAAAIRVGEYLARRRAASGTVYEEIHNYDMTREGGIQLLASDLEGLVRHASPHVAELREVVAWYGENARLARLVHSGGDAGRQAIAGDGGKRARAILAATDTENVDA
ncbi:hypothetical protein G6L37_00130 [Agrobacterium rubi]|nr:hypothetical protein [Agrobacterium rubi]NTF23657.1 hypothetical protein [Agrobacterium rubi]